MKKENWVQKCEIGEECRKFWASIFLGGGNWVPETLEKQDPKNAGKMLCFMKNSLRNSRAVFRKFAIPNQNSPQIRQRKLNPNFFFSNFFFCGHPWDIPAESRDIPPKKFDFPGFEGIPNFLAPTPSCGRPLPHRKISGLKSLGLGSFFR